jgi:hypothetical protein
MKNGKPAFSPGRKEQRMAPRREDSYKATAKLPDPARCDRCGAAYLKGNWTWQAAPRDAQLRTCPACQRIEANQPAGYLTLKGPFFAAHREEILQLVASREAHARSEHPMQRLIGVESILGGVRVTTTDPHLARGLGTAIQNAFQGDLDLDFGPGENLARAAWKR